MNKGTIEIVNKLDLLKEMVLDLNLPEENYIIVGICIIEKFVKHENLETTNSDEISQLVEELRYQLIEKEIRDVNFSIDLGLELGIGCLTKFIVEKKHCR